MEEKVNTINESVSNSTKVCSKCKRELSLDHFSKSSMSKDGYQYICKECKAEAQRTHYYNTKQTPTSIDLSQVSSKDLLRELRLRGYKGELKFTQVIKV